MRFRYPLRFIAAILVLAFGLQEIAHAAPQPIPQAAGSAAQNTPKLSIDAVIQDPAQLEVPIEHMTLKEIHRGTNGKLIIHIQDAHANLSGQESLAAALDQLMTRYDIPLVLVEGASKDVTLNQVKKLTASEDWKSAAKRFLRDGVISGEEYLNLATDHPMQIRGIEYRDLYDASVDAYAKLKDWRKSTLLYLHKARISLDRIKQKLYPKELLEYERIQSEDEDGGGAFAAKLKRLTELAAKSSLETSRFTQLKDLEAVRRKEASIDFNAANIEQARLLALIAARNKSKTIEDLTRASKRFKNAQLSQYLLVKRLFALAEEQGARPSSFPELSKYLAYLETFAGLKFDLLFQDLEALEEETYAALLKDSDDAKKIRAIDRFLGLLERAHGIQMSSKEFARFEANRTAFPTDSWQAFLNRKLGDAGYYSDFVAFESILDDAQSSLAGFYDLVEKRDHAFLENTNRILREENQKCAFLIAGGYHTEHLTKLLREEGSSYVVLTPAVTYETDQNKYEKFLLIPLDAAKRGTLRQMSFLEENSGYGRLTQTYHRDIPNIQNDSRLLSAIGSDMRVAGNKAGHGSRAAEFKSTLEAIGLSVTTDQKAFTQNTNIDAAVLEADSYKHILAVRLDTGGIYFSKPITLSEIADVQDHLKILADLKAHKFRGIREFGIFLIFLLIPTTGVLYVTAWMPQDMPLPVFVARVMFYVIGLFFGAAVYYIGQSEFRPAEKRWQTMKVWFKSLIYNGSDYRLESLNLLDKTIVKFPEESRNIESGSRVSSEEPTRPAMNPRVVSLFNIASLTAIGLTTAGLVVFQGFTLGFAAVLSIAAVTYAASKVRSPNISFALFASTFLAVVLSYKLAESPRFSNNGILVSPIGAVRESSVAPMPEAPANGMEPLEWNVPAGIDTSVNGLKTLAAKAVARANDFGGVRPNEIAGEIKIAEADRILIMADGRFVVVLSDSAGRHPRLVTPEQASAFLTAWSAWHRAVAEARFNFPADDDEATVRRLNHERLRQLYLSEVQRIRRPYLARPRSHETIITNLQNIQTMGLIFFALTRWIIRWPGNGLKKHAPPQKVQGPAGSRSAEQIWGILNEATASRQEITLVVRRYDVRNGHHVATFVGIPELLQGPGSTDDFLVNITNIHGEGSALVEFWPDQVIRIEHAGQSADIEALRRNSLKFMPKKNQSDIDLGNTKDVSYDYRLLSANAIWSFWKKLENPSLQMIDADVIQVRRTEKNGRNVFEVHDPKSKNGKFFVDVIDLVATIYQTQYYLTENKPAHLPVVFPNGRTDYEKVAQADPTSMRIAFSKGMADALANLNTNDAVQLRDAWLIRENILLLVARQLLDSSGSTVPASDISLKTLEEAARRGIADRMADSFEFAYLRSVSETTGYRLSAFIATEVNQPQFSGRGFTLRAEDPSKFQIDRSSPIVQHMNEPWNAEHYKTARYPMKVSTVKDRALFSRHSLKVKVNNMPIKLAGHDEAKIPEELAPYKDQIQDILNHRRAIDPNYVDYNFYITVRQDRVRAGKSQRHPEIHVDGIQGRRYRPKIAPEQTYFVFDTIPTVVFVHPFNFDGYDVDTHDFRTLMTEQADYKKSIRLDPYTVYLLDPYIVHQAALADEDTDRTFIRAEFSKKKFNAIGDTVNPLLTYDWSPYEPRAIPRDLIGYYEKDAEGRVVQKQPVLSERKSDSISGSRVQVQALIDRNVEGIEAAMTSIHRAMTQVDPEWRSKIRALRWLGDQRVRRSADEFAVANDSYDKDEFLAQMFLFVGLLILTRDAIVKNPMSPATYSYPSEAHFENGKDTSILGGMAKVLSRLEESARVLVADPDTNRVISKGGDLPNLEIQLPIRQMEVLADRLEEILEAVRQVRSDLRNASIQILKIQRGEEIVPVPEAIPATPQIENPLPAPVPAAPPLEAPSLPQPAEIGTPAVAQPVASESVQVPEQPAPVMSVPMPQGAVKATGRKKRLAWRYWARQAAAAAIIIFTYLSLPSRLGNQHKEGNPLFTRSLTVAGKELNVQKLANGIVVINRTGAETYYEYHSNEKILMELARVAWVKPGEEPRLLDAWAGMNWSRNTRDYSRIYRDVTRSLETLAAAEVDRRPIDEILQSIRQVEPIVDNGPNGSRTVAVKAGQKLENLRLGDRQQMMRVMGYLRDRPGNAQKILNTEFFGAKPEQVHLNVPGNKVWLPINQLLMSEHLSSNARHFHTLVRTNTPSQFYSDDLLVTVYETDRANDGVEIHVHPKVIPNIDLPLVGSRAALRPEAGMLNDPRDSMILGYAGEPIYLTSGHPNFYTKDSAVKQASKAKVRFLIEKDALGYKVSAYAPRMKWKLFASKTLLGRFDASAPVDADNNPYLVIGRSRSEDTKGYSVNGRIIKTGNREAALLEHVSREQMRITQLQDSAGRLTGYFKISDGNGKKSSTNGTVYEGRSPFAYTLMAATGVFELFRVPGGDSYLRAPPATHIYFEYRDSSHPFIRSKIYRIPARRPRAIRFGKGNETEVRISDVPLLSAIHFAFPAIFQGEPSSAAVIDLGSTNGTSVILPNHQIFTMHKGEVLLTEGTKSSPILLGDYLRYMAMTEAGAIDTSQSAQGSRLSLPKSRMGKILILGVPVIGAAAFWIGSAVNIWSKKEKTEAPVAVKAEETLPPFELQFKDRRFGPEFDVVLRIEPKARQVILIDKERPYEITRTLYLDQKQARRKWADMRKKGQVIADFYVRQGDQEDKYLEDVQRALLFLRRAAELKTVSAEQLGVIQRFIDLADAEEDRLSSGSRSAKQDAKSPDLSKWVGIFERLNGKEPSNPRRIQYLGSFLTSGLGFDPESVKVQDLAQKFLPDLDEQGDIKAFSMRHYTSFDEYIFHMIARGHHGVLQDMADAWSRNKRYFLNAVLPRQKAYVDLIARLEKAMDGIPLDSLPVEDSNKLTELRQMKSAVMRPKLLRAIVRDAEDLIQRYSLTLGSRIAWNQIMARETNGNASVYHAEETFIQMGDLYYTNLDPDELIKMNPERSIRPEQIIQAPLVTNPGLEANFEYGAHDIGAIRMLMDRRKEIEGHAFIDAGAGASGILGKTALKLGAAKVIAIEEVEARATALHHSLSRTPEVLAKFEIMRGSVQDALHTMKNDGYKSLSGDTKPVFCANVASDERNDIADGPDFQNFLAEMDAVYLFPGFERRGLVSHPEPEMDSKDRVEQFAMDAGLHILSKYSAELERRKDYDHYSYGFVGIKPPAGSRTASISETISKPPAELSHDQILSLVQKTSGTKVFLIESAPPNVPFHYYKWRIQIEGNDAAYLAEWTPHRFEGQNGGSLTLTRLVSGNPAGVSRTINGGGDEKEFTDKFVSAALFLQTPLPEVAPAKVPAAALKAPAIQGAIVNRVIWHNPPSRLLLDILEAHSDLDVTLSVAEDKGAGERTFGREMGRYSLLKLVLLDMPQNKPVRVQVSGGDPAARQELYQKLEEFFSRPQGSRAAEIKDELRAKFRAEILDFLKPDEAKVIGNQFEKVLKVWEGTDDLESKANVFGMFVAEWEELPVHRMYDQLRIMSNDMLPKGKGLLAAWNQALAAAQSQISGDDEPAIPEPKKNARDASGLPDISMSDEPLRYIVGKRKSLSEITRLINNVFFRIGVNADVFRAYIKADGKWEETRLSSPAIENERRILLSEIQDPNTLLQTYKNKKNTLAKLMGERHSQALETLRLAGSRAALPDRPFSFETFMKALGMWGRAHLQSNEYAEAFIEAGILEKASKSGHGVSRYRFKNGLEFWGIFRNLKDSEDPAFKSLRRINSTFHYGAAQFWALRTSAGLSHMIADDIALISNWGDGAFSVQMNQIKAEDMTDVSAIIRALEKIPADAQRKPELVIFMRIPQKAKRERVIAALQSLSLKLKALPPNARFINPESRRIRRKLTGQIAQILKNETPAGARARKEDEVPAPISLDKAVQRFFDKGYYVAFEDEKGPPDALPRVYVRVRHPGADALKQNEYNPWFRDGNRRGGFTVTPQPSTGKLILDNFYPKLPRTGELLGVSFRIAALLLKYGDQPIHFEMHYTREDIYNRLKAIEGVEVTWDPQKRLVEGFIPAPSPEALSEWRARNAANQAQNPSGSRAGRLELMQEIDLAYARLSEAAAILAKYSDQNSRRMSVEWIMEVLKQINTHELSVLQPRYALITANLFHARALLPPIMQALKIEPLDVTPTRFRDIREALNRMEKGLVYLLKSADAASELSGIKQPKNAAGSRGADWTGAPSREDLHALLRRFNTDLREDVRYGDPTFVFFLAVHHMEQAVEYLDEIVHKRPHTVNVLNLELPGGIFVRKGGTEILAREYQAKHGSSEISNYKDMEGYLKLSGMQNAVVTNADFPDPYLTLFEETVHVPQRSFGDAGEIINTFIQILFVPTEKLKNQYSNPYFLKTTPEEMVALQKRYVLDPGLNPNEQLIEILTMLRADIKADNSISVQYGNTTQEVRILDAINRTIAESRGAEDRRFNWKQKMTNALDAEIRSSRFIGLKPIFPGWDFSNLSSGSRAAEKSKYHLDDAKFAEALLNSEASPLHQRQKKILISYFDLEMKGHQTIGQIGKAQARQVVHERIRQIMSKTAHLVQAFYDSLTWKDAADKKSIRALKLPIQIERFLMHQYGIFTIDQFYEIPVEAFERPIRGLGESGINRIKHALLDQGIILKSRADLPLAYESLGLPLGHAVFLRSHGIRSVSVLTERTREEITELLKGANSGIDLRLSTLESFLKGLGFNFAGEAISDDIGALNLFQSGKYSAKFRLKQLGVWTLSDMLKPDFPVDKLQNFIERDRLMINAIIQLHRGAGSRATLAIGTARAERLERYGLLHAWRDLRAHAAGGVITSKAILAMPESPATKNVVGRMLRHLVDLGLLERMERPQDADGGPQTNYYKLREVKPSQIAAVEFLLSESYFADFDVPIMAEQMKQVLQEQPPFKLPSRRVDYEKQAEQLKSSGIAAPNLYLAFNLLWKSFQGVFVKPSVAAELMIGAESRDFRQQASMLEDLGLIQQVKRSSNDGSYWIQPKPLSKEDIAKVKEAFLDYGRLRDPRVLKDTIDGILKASESGKILGRRGTLKRILGTELKKFPDGELDLPAIVWAIDLVEKDLHDKKMPRTKALLFEVRNKLNELNPSLRPDRLAIGRFARDRGIDLREIGITGIALPSDKNAFLQMVVRARDYLREGDRKYKNRPMDVREIAYELGIHPHVLARQARQLDVDLESLDLFVLKYSRLSPKRIASTKLYLNDIGVDAANEANVAYALREPNAVRKAGRSERLKILNAERKWKEHIVQQSSDRRLMYVLTHSSEDEAERLGFEQSFGSLEVTRQTEIMDLLVRQGKVNGLAEAIPEVLRRYFDEIFTIPRSDRGDGIPLKMGAGAFRDLMLAAEIEYPGNLAARWKLVYPALERASLQNQKSLTQRAEAVANIFSQEARALRHSRGSRAADLNNLLKGIRKGETLKDRAALLELNPQGVLFAKRFKSIMNSSKISPADWGKIRQFLKDTYPQPAVEKKVVPIQPAPSVKEQVVPSYESLKAFVDRLIDELIAKGYEDPAALRIYKDLFERAAVRPDFGYGFKKSPDYLDSMTKLPQVILNIDEIFRSYHLTSIAGSPDDEIAFGLTLVRESKGLLYTAAHYLSEGIKTRAYESQAELVGSLDRDVFGLVMASLDQAVRRDPRLRSNNTEVLKTLSTSLNLPEYAGLRQNLLLNKTKIYEAVAAAIHSEHYEALEKIKAFRWARDLGLLNIAKINPEVLKSRHSQFLLADASEEYQLASELEIMTAVRIRMMLQMMGGNTSGIDLNFSAYLLFMLLQFCEYSESNGERGMNPSGMIDNVINGKKATDNFIKPAKVILSLVQKFNAETESKMTQIAPTALERILQKTVSNDAVASTPALGASSPEAAPAASTLRDSLNRAGPLQFTEEQVTRLVELVRSYPGMPDSGSLNSQIRFWNHANPWVVNLNSAQIDVLSAYGIALKTGARPKLFAVAQSGQSRFVTMLHERIRAGVPRNALMKEVEIHGRERASWSDILALNDYVKNQLKQDYPGNADEMSALYKQVIGSLLVYTFAMPGSGYEGATFPGYDRGASELAMPIVKQMIRQRSAAQGRTRVVEFGMSSGNETLDISKELKEVASNVDFIASDYLTDLKLVANFVAESPLEPNLEGIFDQQGRLLWIRHNRGGAYSSLKLHSGLTLDAETQRAVDYLNEQYRKGEGVPFTRYVPGYIDAAKKNFDPGHFSIAEADVMDPFSLPGGPVDIAILANVYNIPILGPKKYQLFKNVAANMNAGGHLIFVANNRINPGASFTGEKSGLYEIYRIEEVTASDGKTRRVAKLVDTHHHKEEIQRLRQLGRLAGTPLEDPAVDSKIGDAAFQAQVVMQYLPVIEGRLPSWNLGAEIPLDQEDFTVIPHADAKLHMRLFIIKESPSIEKRSQHPAYAPEGELNGVRALEIELDRNPSIAHRDAYKAMLTFKKSELEQYIRNRGTPSGARTVLDSSAVKPPQNDAFLEKGMELPARVVEADGQVKETAARLVAAQMTGSRIAYATTNRDFAKFRIEPAGSDYVFTDEFSGKTAVITKAEVDGLKVSASRTSVERLADRGIDIADLRAKEAIQSAVRNLKRGLALLKKSPPAGARIIVSLGLLSEAPEDLETNLLLLRPLQSRILASPETFGHITIGFRGTAKEVQMLSEFSQRLRSYLARGMKNPSQRNNRALQADADFVASLLLRTTVIGQEPLQVAPDERVGVVADPAELDRDPELKSLLADGVVSMTPAQRASPGAYISASELVTLSIITVAHKSFKDGRWVVDETALDEGGEEMNYFRSSYDDPNLLFQDVAMLIVPNTRPQTIARWISIKIKALNIGARVQEFRNALVALLSSA